MTMRRNVDPRERAARALCRRDGHPENTKFEGKPMWQSYLDTVDLVLAEAGSTDRRDTTLSAAAETLRAAMVGSDPRFTLGLDKAVDLVLALKGRP